MASIVELARERCGLDGPRVQHLQRLVRSWGLLADLSFSDLLLFGRDHQGGQLILLGHVRPTTAQTIYRTDLVGRELADDEQPVASRAFQERRITEGRVPLLGPTEPVNVLAIPVRWHGEVLAVMTRESLPLSRHTSDLERTYLELFARLTRMIEAGTYPFGRDPDDQYKAPRVGDGVLVVDFAGRVEYNSPNAVSALHRLGVHVNAEGFTLGELGLEDDVVRSAFAARMPAIAEIERGPEITVVLNCIPLLDKGAVTGGIILVRDISELRRRDRLLVSKDATIREIHHRVKNNLQTISSLLRLQSRRLAAGEARLALEESVRRIGSIAVVHETLAQEIADEAPFGEVVRPLIAMVEEGLASPERPIDFKVSGEAGVLPAVVTTPLALVVTELLQNVVEHAFPADHQGPCTVLVEMERAGEVVRLRVLDDGVGVADGFSLASASGLGLTIVRNLVESDLGGTIAIGRRRDGSGTWVQLEIPVDASRER